MLINGHFIKVCTCREPLAIPVILIIVGSVDFFTPSIINNNGRLEAVIGWRCSRSVTVLNCKLIIGAIVVAWSYYVRNKECENRNGNHSFGNAKFAYTNEFNIVYPVMLIGMESFGLLRRSPISKIKE